RAVVERPVVLQGDLKMLLVVGLNRLGYSRLDVFRIRVDLGQPHEHSVDRVSAAHFIGGDRNQRILRCTAKNTDGAAFLGFLGALAAVITTAPACAEE